MLELSVSLLFLAMCLDVPLNLYMFSVFFLPFSSIFSYLQPFFCTLAALSRCSMSFSLSWTLWGGTDTLLGHLGVFSGCLRALLVRSEELLGTPWTPLGRFGDHVGSSEGLLGRSPELSGSFLGALGESLARLGSDFGSICGICLMDSGICSI